VIVGQVDSRGGPGVFFRIREMRPGEEIVVTRADGSAVRFVVDTVEQYAKDAFPAGRVYGDTPGPQLRLITCGGSFGRAARSYRDNVVVFATSL
jgi:Sortase domain